MHACRFVLSIVLFFCVSQSVIAAAQDRPDNYTVAVKQSCGKELKRQCKGVKEGRGRLLACLYAREDKLSAKCGEVVSASLVRLGEALGALANVRRVCERDALRLCNGVVAGNGNLIGCLTTARRSVSPECNATMDSAFLRP